MEIGFAPPGASTKNNRLVDLIADSRSYDASANSLDVGLTGVHWLNWANALNGHRLSLNINAGWSGSRSDQWLLGLDPSNNPVRPGIAGLLNSPAAWVIVGYPIVNDLAQSGAGYTDRNGTVVTASNVAAVAAANIQKSIAPLLAVGKRLIITPEVGGTTLPQAAVGQMHEFNMRMRAYADTTDNVWMWDPRPALWLPATSGTATTAVTFKPGMLRTGDPTHFSVAGGKAAGATFAAFINTLIPYADNGPASVTDNSAVNPRQMTPNPLFNTLTGGTTSGGVVLSSGTVPSGYTLQGAATSSVAITSAADPNGGNAITLAITASAADVVGFHATAPATSAWNLNDLFEQQIDIDVAAGSSNAWVYCDTQVNTNLGTNDWWAMFADASYAPYPTDAYSIRQRTQAGVVRAGSATKGYIQARMNIRFIAAGSMTLTLRRPSFVRRF